VTGFGALETGGISAEVGRKEKVCFGGGEGRKQTFIKTGNSNLPWTEFEEGASILGTHMLWDSKEMLWILATLFHPR
jgi:hypothetical protein